MKALMTLLLLVSASVSFAQTDPTPSEAIKALNFMTGTWKGVQKFVTGGDPMEANVLDETKPVVSSRFLEEALSVDLKGKKSDTRHLMTYDPKSKTYKAWWFNDTRAGATEFEGTFDGTRLIMASKPIPGPGGREVILKVTYEKVAGDKLGYGLEMKQGEDWIKLFHTEYSRA